MARWSASPAVPEDRSTRDVRDANSDFLFDGSMAIPSGNQAVVRVSEVGRQATGREWCWRAGRR